MAKDQELKYTVFGAVANCGTKIILQVIDRSTKTLVKQVIDKNVVSRELNASYLYVYSITSNTVPNENGETSSDVVDM